MVKSTKTKTYDTETATVVKKVTIGAYGDPAGYETTMYQTPEGDYFLYTNGGAASDYKKEAITAYTKAKAEEWLKNNWFFIKSADICRRFYFLGGKFSAIRASFVSTFILRFPMIYFLR